MLSRDCSSAHELLWSSHVLIETPKTHNESSRSERKPRQGKIINFSQGATSNSHCEVGSTIDHDSEGVENAGQTPHRFLEPPL